MMVLSLSDVIITLMNIITNAIRGITTEEIRNPAPRFEMGDEFKANPNLSLSTVSFSYKSSPTQRKPRKRNPEEMIW